MTLHFASAAAPAVTVDFPVEGSLTGGLLKYAGVLVDHRGFQVGQVSGMVVGLCGTGEPEPVEVPDGIRAGWSFAGSLAYADL